MESFVALCIAFICALFFVNIKAGISAYIVFFFLVPVDPPFLITSSSNIVQLSLLTSLFLYSQNHRTHQSLGCILKPFLPLIILYFLFLLFSLFGDGTSFSYSFLKWQLHIRRYFLLSIIMWYVSNTDVKAVQWFNAAFVFSGVIILLYGFLLLFTNGFNPYVLLLSTTFDVSDWANVVNERDSFRYMFRISSVFLHPMSYGLYLCLFTFFLYSISSKLNSKVEFLGLIALCLVCVLMSGVRTAMVSLFLGIIVYLLFLRRIKTTLLFFFLGVIVFYIISQIPSISGTIDSLVNSNNELSGSSVDTRLIQFEGCFQEIRSSFLFGKGYEWTQYYMEEFGNHPTMLAFESVIIKVLCESGLMGMIAFVICYFVFTHNAARRADNRESKALVWTLVAVFLIYCSATGDYDYSALFMPFFSIFYINHCRKPNKSKS